MSPSVLASRLMVASEAFRVCASSLSRTALMFECLTIVQDKEREWRTENGGVELEGASENTRLGWDQL